MRTSVARPLLLDVGSGYGDNAMRKIPTLYERDPGTRRRYVYNVVRHDCQWVIDGEGWPTYKWDGTAVRIDTDGRAWKRRELLPSSNGPAEWWQEGEADPVTGKRVGWVPVDPDDPGDQWHREAVDSFDDGELTAGTYELVGPKVQSNPHGFMSHHLIRHGTDWDADRNLWDGMPDPSEFDRWGEWLHSRPAPGFEGIVWHHPDGRMCKIKAKDFPA